MHVLVRKEDADQVPELDETRRALITKLEQAQARRNAASKEIGQAKAKKDEATAQRLMAEVGELKTTIPAMEVTIPHIHASYVLHVF